jgi:hypothetical protein
VRQLQSIRDIRRPPFKAALATNNGFGRSTVPDWDRGTDHGNATKHGNQTELERMHDGSVAAAMSQCFKSLKSQRRGRDGHLRDAGEDTVYSSRAERRRLGIEGAKIG